ncbi:MAG: hypothetical protein OSP8Acid_09990 [uncultured Acidilobus sp. OSP8]|nr:MAG: hypothetical protein OSP8Acid_09990 [uncultured Acidilobus sp. OSP8]
MRYLIIGAGPAGL